MPTPFPGMDPFLEHPGRWPSVHQRLITYLGDHLNTLLPARYVANIGERVYVVDPAKDLYPDTFVVRKTFSEGTQGNGKGGLTVAPVSDPPPVLAGPDPVEIREVFLEIQTAVDPGEVVTIIEILSPSNKTPGHEGRDLYLRKQKAVLGSKVHLLEIDLLRKGQHTVAAPESMPWSYLVCLHRGGQGRRFEIWAIALAQPLPRIHIPLAEGDSDVVLDLQRLLSHVYDEGKYARRIDYRQPCEPALTEEEADWAQRVLKEKGLAS